MVEVKGYCDEPFNNVKMAFAKNFELGLEKGASFAVMIDGKLVVDIWGGYTDAAQTKYWEKDTIVNVWSTTKIMTALCVHILVDRGLIELDAPVIKYWPEFGQVGKEKILVRHILSHTSGVAGWDTKFTYKELVNWEKCVSLLETQKPWWEPGAKSGYHTISFGFLLGELVRRVTGKTIGTFFKEEVAEPLNADFHIGFSEEHDKRVSELIFKETSSWVILLARIFLKYVYKSGLNPRPNLAVANTRSWRGAEVPASNGHGNARSIVQIGSILACGGKINGTRFLSSSTVEDAIKEQIRGRDLVLGLAIPETRWALGFALCPINALSSYTDEELVGPRSFYWSGLGGSICIMDPDAKMCIAYAMNNLCNPLKKDKRVFRIVNALHSCLSD